MKSFAKYNPSPFLTLFLVLALPFQNEHPFLQAHFLFTKLVPSSSSSSSTSSSNNGNDGGQDVAQVFFSEPVAMEGKVLSRAHLSDRIRNLVAIQPPPSSTSSSSNYAGPKCLEASMSPIGTSFPDVDGTIGICFNTNSSPEASSASSTLTMASVTGLEPNIPTDGAGVHIHEGTACDTTATQGGHYYNSDNGVDPWLSGAKYYTNGEGVSSGSSFQFDNGYDYDSTIGKVAVIHASNGNRIACGVLRPTSRVVLPLLSDDAAEYGYLSAPLPSWLSSSSSSSSNNHGRRPLLVTGYLDFGDWGEGDAPKKDLQYTFSAQAFSTNPSDDWKNFFHNFRDMEGYTDAFPAAQPFAIALRNYGPPYEVVARGVSDSTVIDVCLYEGNGSNRKVGCATGTTEGKNHIMIDSIDDDDERLNPCETYFALANATGIEEGTGKAQSLWSSTSVVWNGPCGPITSSSSRYSQAEAAASLAGQASTTKGVYTISPIISSGITVFVCMALLSVFHLTRGKKSDERQTETAEHSKLHPADDETEMASYQDNATSVDTGEIA
eukprot:CAMPEP_0196131646 /NCGR_PEP_ID=MMETSP0910-20130528/1558_1 /TAXON_ID=49265 /ORGANISM="Thalassiosira rotula, Strain GSO102" /LENGTH=550 /DNA_ID=CAMNT_0041391129 /DNA_START=183 /DNA_END=1835 /DNA_ORIENTATION=-